MYVYVRTSFSRHFEEFSCRNSIKKTYVKQFYNGFVKLGCHYDWQSEELRFAPLKKKNKLVTYFAARLRENSKTPGFKRKDCVTKCSAKLWYFLLDLRIFVGQSKYVLVSELVYITFQVEYASTLYDISFANNGNVLVLSRFCFLQ